MTKTTTLPTGTWTLDPAATKVAVTVKKMKLITVTANLTVTSGSISIADGQVASVNVAADAASYDSSNAKRDEHVASPDFLDAAAHPTITFSAAGSSGGVPQKLSGEVTIKGKSTPVTFAVSDVNVDGTVGTFTAATVVDRVKLGIDKMPAFVIGKDLDIKVTATARLEA